MEICNVMGYLEASPGLPVSCFSHISFHLTLDVQEFMSSDEVDNLPFKGLIHTNVKMTSTFLSTKA